LSTEMAIGIGGIVIGILVSAVFYWLSLRPKRAAYSIRSNNLIRETVKSWSSLEVLYGGQPIPTLTASKLAFWNDGKTTIHGTDITAADPLIIRAAEHTDCAILDAAVVHETCPPNRFSLQRSPDGSAVLVEFDYMDPDQGAVIQLLHTGFRSDDLLLLGTMKGAGQPRRLSYLSPAALQFPGTTRLRPATKRLVLLPVFCIAPLAILISFLWPFVYPGRNLERLHQPTALDIVMMSVFVVFICFSSLFFFFMLRRRTPRGFDAFEEDRWLAR